ncbi:enediyne biosynthesis protein UnbU [Sphaerisporangium sp. TRM90804]|uniref:enediyne biosynthesis protein UnbU n=1 Tax=Sphaerisporangium sp. TRM90804 TaxID=3031113 RepID=UPI002446C4E3|nr:enediyne biosynthesis protein UnbU [Sphaerisporangium sp. TRM90804]MDH2429181.1 enediyne biosynthesis protein UnbU [Sphaerisporangium sp. TRM90804]
MSPKKDPRTIALRRFAMSISVFTIVGHTLLGFEQAYLTPVAAILTAYAMEIGLEALDAWARRRPAKFPRSVGGMVDFLLPAHITGLACAMLLYANARVEPVMAAVVIGIASKYVVRVRIGASRRHVLNPSNFGIVAVLLLFPWVGIAPPYHFTEWVSGPLDWIIPAAILASGTMLNAMLTKKMPLILAWVGGFALQAVVRTAIEGTSTVNALTVMTGVAFVLFTNYMITDPGTTPVAPARQVAFGLATAATYGVLVAFHVVFGMFFALVIVCVFRGALVAYGTFLRETAWPDPRAAARPAAVPQPGLAVAGGTR